MSQYSAKFTSFSLYMTWCICLAKPFN